MDNSKIEIVYSKRRAQKGEKGDTQEREWDRDRKDNISQAEKRMRTKGLKMGNSLERERMDSEKGSVIFLSVN